MHAKIRNSVSKTFKNFSCAAVMGLMCSPVAMAHDFWLSPSDWQMDAPRPIALDIMIGHPEDRMQWELKPHRVVSLRSISAAGITDLQSAMSGALPNGALMINGLREGTHMLTIETTSAISVLDAAKFNAYIKEEGLTPISDARKLAGTQDTEGRETYSRRGKALIRVGDDTASDAAFITKPLGMTLEVVPAVNPYEIEAGETMPAQVYYRGNPAAGVTVGLIRLDDDSGIVALAKTDSAGMVTFSRPETGNWMLHAVWSDTLPKNSTADYDTIFSSLSFGWD